MPRYCDVVFNLPLHQVFTYDCLDFPGCGTGKRVRAPFRGRKLVGFVVGLKEEMPDAGFQIKKIEHVIDAEPVASDNVIRLSGWLSSLYLCSLGEALALMVPGGKKEVETEGAITFYDSDEFAIQALNQEQEKALERIRSLNEPFFYLYGVTGSGKTLVFLHMAKEIFEKGGGIIYLVPEIALTHQVITAFQEVFSNEVVRNQLAVLHSGLSASQRLGEWMRILKGQARIVVGVRSAVFAPLPSLGLIVIDEEHENTYKAGSTPRYHARQVAMHRVQEEGGILLMGSATPSVEAWHLMQSGKLAHAHLTQRASGGQMPHVEIIDLNNEPGPLSRPLIAAIEETKARGRQTILFLNRRGFSHFFRCRSCGFEMKCRRCSVSLTFHKMRGLFICHYCGFKTKPVSVCPECQSLDVGSLGFGTERIEEDMARIFPHMTIRRVDTDTMKKKRELEKVLREFKEGKIDILLGTQMVAKGLNVRGVSLVGIVLADTSLLLPDFRSAERTFNLIVQVGGRAGRFDKEGKVLIQTYRGSHDAIACASRLEIDEYYQGELEVRRELGFPPFARLIRLVFRGKENTRTHDAAAAFARLYGRLLAKKTDDRAAENEPDIEILGPAECPLAMISHNHRYQLILRSLNFARLHTLLREALVSFKTPSGVYIEIDVDPLSLL